MKFSLIASLLAMSFLSTSCSWYRNMERSLIEDDKKVASKNRNRPVPREQYDELLTKYEDLQKQYMELKEGKPAQSSLVDEVQKTRSENFASAPAAATNVETETVDVFPPTGAQVVVSTSPAVPASLEAQLELYRRGVALKASNPGEATKIFQQLESTGEPSVKVRSKLQIGEMLYSKNQYDLALQVFEDIITKNSESGVVIDALKFAAVCSDKLGNVAKRDQYTSMLNDVFEVK